MRHLQKYKSMFKIHNQISVLGLSEKQILYYIIYTTENKEGNSISKDINTHWKGFNKTW